MNTIPVIRSRLKEVMESRGMSKLSDLVRASGVSYPTVSSIYHARSIHGRVRAKGHISWPVLAKLCDALKCQPGDLLVMEYEGEDEQTGPLPEGGNPAATLDPEPDKPESKVSAEEPDMSTPHGRAGILIHEGNT